MKKIEYLTMLCQDNETEKEPMKELHEAVIKCTVEAVSQESDDFEIDSKIGLPELWKIIETAGRATKAQNVQCVSSFRAAEMIAEKLGAQYTRPIDRIRAQIARSESKQTASVNLEDFL